MTEFIFLIILISSLLVMGVILFRKIPVLVKLEKESSVRLGWGYIFLNSAKKIKNLTFLKNFSTEIFLQKLLSKIRILTLKIESKTSGWLQKLRENSQKKKLNRDDNYWKEIKKSADQIQQKIRRKKPPA